MESENLVGEVLFREEFSELKSEGIIGFYKSCVVTNYYVHNTETNKYYNFFSRILFSEKEFKDSGLVHGKKTYTLDKKHKLCYGQFTQTIEMASTGLDELFSSKFTKTSGLNNLQVSVNKCIPKQYSPNSGRIAKALDVNPNGDYFLELFDQKKDVIKPFYSKLQGVKFTKFAEEAKKENGIDISLITDKAGGILYQFPATIVNLDVKCPSSTLLTVSFDWHSKLTSVPEALIQIQGNIGHVITAAVNEEYNKKKTQEITITNSDGNLKLSLYLKSPNLIISSADLSYPRITSLRAGGMYDHKVRIFEVDGKKETISIVGYNSQPTNGEDYLRYISANTYSEEKKFLEQTLAFKQYSIGSRGDALSDIRKLISSHDRGAVYLWDPFLRSNDIMETLYYSSNQNSQLRAIGAITDASKLVYEKKVPQASEKIEQIYQIVNSSLQDL
ncbi:MAG: hypothetical protein EOO43_14015 [Flavobacterium sp.]|nr:MAG: hypothetical protein EOO43_14015 [Flavobacterium sp.]